MTAHEHALAGNNAGASVVEYGSLLVRHGSMWDLNNLSGWYLWDDDDNLKPLGCASTPKDPWPWWPTWKGDRRGEDHHDVRPGFAEREDAIKVRAWYIAERVRVTHADDVPLLVAEWRARKALGEGGNS